MAVTNVPSETRRSRSNALRVLASLVAGIFAGAVYYYVTVVVGTAPIASGFTTSPLTLLLLAVLSAVAVVGSWRWPLIGIPAGGMMIVIVLFAVLQRIDWSSASEWLNPFQAVGYGAVSGYPAMIAAVLLATSILRVRLNRSIN